MFAYEDNEEEGLKFVEFAFQGDRKEDGAPATALLSSGALLYACCTTKATHAKEGKLITYEKAMELASCQIVDSILNTIDLHRVIHQ